VIGVGSGAPMEFKGRQTILPVGKLPKWTPERVSNSLEQDDLYLDIAFARALDDKGRSAIVEDFGTVLREARYKLWHANLAAPRNLERGVPASLFSAPWYNVHANGIDFPIEFGLHRPDSSGDAAIRATHCRTCRTCDELR